MPASPSARRAHPPAHRLRAVAAFVAAAVLAVGVAGDVGAQVGVVYEAPVAGPVVDPFRAPVTTYGPGNRGIEYDTQAGDVVRASADGTVVFAGPVGASLHVTVQHADGVRTSVSFLQRVDVVAGQVVQRGDPVGQAGDRLHFGARRGDSYFDPATLLGSTTTGVEVELLPLDLPPGGDPDDESHALAAMVDVAVPGLDTATNMLVQRARLSQHYATSVDPVRRSLVVAGDVASALADPPPCSDGPSPERPVAGQARRALLVGGLGSTSDSASVDDLRTADLGYAPDAVEKFSFAGPGRPYSSADTQGDLIESGRRLADAVEQALADHPGAALDLYAHSMGGVVARLAIDELGRRGVDLDRLGLVTTLGTPHHGADLATAVAAANATVRGRLGLEAADAWLDTGLDPQSPAAAQLAETSSVVRQLDEVGVPDGVELLSVAASGDHVVASPSSQVDGARNVIVSLTGLEAHGAVVGADETTDEIARALAGEPQVCRSAEEVVREKALGHGLSYLQDAAGLAVLNGAP
jgi:hypothetical protein